MKQILQRLNTVLHFIYEVILFSSACLIFSFSVHATPIAVTDGRGAVLSFDKPPQRVISLLPSLTESVCAIGKCNTLVGVDRYSNWPKIVNSLPKLGGMGDVNIERIVQLKPDLVLLEKTSSVMARLNSLGIKTLGLDIKSMEDEHRTLQKLDVVFSIGEGARVWEEIQLQITRANKQLLPLQKNSRIYFEVNPAPFAAGRTSFIGEILDRLQLINIIPASLGPFPKINPEFVVHANPQVIFLSESNLGQIQDRPGWNSIAAIRERRICSFGSDQNDVLIRPGPRMGEAALLISSCISQKMPSSK